MRPATIMSGAANSCIGDCHASSWARQSGSASRTVPSAATKTRKIVPTYTGSEPRWVRLVTVTAMRATVRSVRLYASGAVNGSTRRQVAHEIASAPTNTAKPSAMVPSDSHSAGSSPCHSARCAGCAGAGTPGVASGAVSAYRANAASSAGGAKPAATVSAESTIGAETKPSGGRGHSVTGFGAPEASFFVQNAPQTNLRPYA